MNFHLRHKSSSLLAAFVAVIMFLPSESVTAQHTELGLMAGTMAYTGDVIHTYMRHNDYQPAFGIFIAKPVSSHFSLRLMLNKGYISGADSLAARPSSRERNLSFYSDLYEGSVLVDFYPFAFLPTKGRNKIAPYFSTGLTVFHFNPMSIYQGQEYALQPLSTEGQGTSAFPDRKPYQLTQIAIPAEMGIKFMIGNSFSLNVAGGFRYTFTDYLDDVSTTYVNADVLIAERGEVAYALSNRTWGTNEGVPDDLGNGYKRGGLANDHYGWIGTTLSYYFAPRYKFAQSRKSGLHCPKF